MYEGTELFACLLLYRRTTLPTYDNNSLKIENRKLEEV